MGLADRQLAGTAGLIIVRRLAIAIAPVPEMANSRFDF
jgi:hypothetical protein